MIESGFYQALAGDPTITGIVGSNVFLGWRKAMSVPSVVISATSKGSIDSFDGRNQLEIGRFQFDAFANDYFTTLRLAEAIKNKFVPLSTQVNNYPYLLPDGSGIASATVHNELDMPEEVGSGGGYLYRRMVDIEFAFVSS